MDTLTFASPILLRRLTFSEMRKEPILEIHLDKVLEGLGLNMDEFIDLCILLGCDYCDSIKGIGPTRAIQLIKQHRCIEKILENIDAKRYPIPEDWPYVEARRLFKEADVQNGQEVDLKWNAPDEEGLVQYLVREKNFSEDRIRSGAKRLLKAKGKSTQSRLDSFIKVIPRDDKAKKAQKRKPETKNKKISKQRK